MRRRYLALAIAILISMALVLGVGLWLKAAVLGPLGLYGDVDPAVLPLRLLADRELREAIREGLSGA